MPIYFENTKIIGAYFNGTALTKLAFNGVEYPFKESIVYPYTHIITTVGFGRVTENISYHCSEPEVGDNRAGFVIFVNGVQQTPFVDLITCTNGVLDVPAKIIVYENHTFDFIFTAYTGDEYTFSYNW